MPKEFDSLLNERLTDGENRLACPACGPHRKAHNRHEKTLAVRDFGDRITYHCWHCDEKGVVLRKEGGRPYFLTLPDPREEAKMKPIQGITDLNDDCYNWLQERGISGLTADRANLKRGKVRGTDAVAFPYTDMKGEVTGFKLRSITIPKSDKPFSITGFISGAFLSPLVDTTHPQLVITEGELDALACLEAGVVNPVSIPHGAINEGTTTDTTKLSFLSEIEPLLKDRKRVVILTDNDGPGKATGAEIARRVGRWRAFRVMWPEECKDANEVLMKQNPDALHLMTKNAEAVEIPGIAKPIDFRNDLIRFRNGDVLRGESTGYPGLDSIFRLTPGVLTTITGTPGSGKSEIMDQLHVNLAKRLNWNCALWSRENAEFVHTAKLIEKYARKRFHPTQNNCMTDDELELSLAWINDHFTFLTHDEDSSIDSILERMSVAVLRSGIKMAAIDPYNYITKSGDAREDLIVSEMLTKMSDWCKGHEAHMFLVAHPTKLVNPGTIPNGNHISGGANFWNKTDFGLTVNRPGDGIMCEVHNWKTRHSWLGKVGKTDLAYDVKTASYYDPDAAEPIISNYKWSSQDDENEVPF